MNSQKYLHKSLITLALISAFSNGYAANYYGSPTHVSGENISYDKISISGSGQYFVGDEDTQTVVVTGITGVATSNQNYSANLTITAEEKVDLQGYTNLGSIFANEGPGSLTIASNGEVHFGRGVTVYSGTKNNGSLTVGSETARVNQVIFDEDLSNSGETNIFATGDVSFNATLSTNGGLTHIDTFGNLVITSNDTYTASTGDDSGALYAKMDSFDVNLHSAQNISITQTGSSYAINMQGKDSAGVMSVQAKKKLSINGHVSATATQRATSSLILSGGEGIVIDTGETNHSLINSSVSSK